MLIKQNISQIEKTQSPIFIRALISVYLYKMECTDFDGSVNRMTPCPLSNRLTSTL